MIALPQDFVTAASALAATALNALWQDALLVASVWLLLRAWPRINAATRYAVWCATLVAAIAVPIATTLPFFAVAAATPVTRSAVAARHHAGAATANVAVARTATEKLAAAREPISVARTPQLPRRPRITVAPVVGVIVFIAWLGLAGYALARLLLGLVRLEQLKRDALPLPVEYRDAMSQWIRASKGGRDVRLCVSDEIDVPVAVGLFDAMILIPRSLLERLSPEEIDQISLHELAHLRRADDWTNGLQRIIVALLGWNPAAQFISAQLDLEREVACDDCVLSRAVAVRPYALCLTKMAETSSWPRHPMPAPGVFASRKHISMRIERLLGAGRNIATNLSPAPAAAAVVVVGALTLAIGLVAPSVAMPAGAPQAAETAANPAATTAPKPRASARVTHVDIVHIPATHVHLPAQTIHVPAVNVDIPEPKVAVRIPRIDTRQIVRDVNAEVGHDVGAALKDAEIGADTGGNSKACVGCDFAGVNWAGRDLHGAAYTGVDLSRANLDGANLSNGSFNGVDFSHGNLAGASFRSARLTGCDFSGADLAGADFTGARLSGCVGFAHANLRDANLAGAEFVGVDFSGATLDGANLVGATFNGCDLSGVDLTHVDLSKTKIIGSDLSRRRSPESPP